jgi:hypothetical protein
MATLSDEDRQKAIQILDQTRAQIEAAAADDPDLRFQLRRYILKRLEFDERGTPTQRRRLKDLKRRFQRVCATSAPSRCPRRARSCIA